jgi:hypothetical protein
MVRELQIINNLEQNGRGVTLGITSPYDGRDCGKTWKICQHDMTGGRADTHTPHFPDTKQLCSSVDRDIRSSKNLNIRAGNCDRGSSDELHAQKLRRLCSSWPPRDVNTELQLFYRTHGNRADIELTFT